ncbi:hypothetical protein [Azospirillum picis]|uniref:DUF2336 domain-containing protein n=1 Tax=Azospirillum picis TaxID=488438 RepID=A0ABU0MUT5_9PROT|nr:hypothetical protein [Azospirillum picis]MBP2301897.1 hypothetical protein [Azospirillum picis]MDQ0537249.1 hypothetical protein [Azospirillum picis]
MIDDLSGAQRPDLRDELHQDDLRRKIDDLVTRLPASLVYNLLSEIEGMDGEPSDRLQLVRQYVIEYLNRQRTNRARRLFTSLFESFLIDDDALYHGGVSIPGMLQRVDVGALWEALSRDAFPLLAVEAQETLDEMARGEVIDRVLRSPVALAMRGRMRAAAVKHLDAVLASKRATDELLAGLSRNRPRRTRLMSGFLEKTPPVDAGTLRLMHLVLSGADGPVKLVADRLEDFPSAAAGELEANRLADRLLDAVDALRDRCGDEVASLLPLSVLTVKGNYAVSALYVRLSGVDPGRGDAMTAALTGHFIGVTRALTAALAVVLKLNERVPGSAIRPSAKEKARLEALVQRLDRLVHAATSAGLMEDRRSEPAFRNAWTQAARIIGSRVAAVALERSSQAAASRRQTVIDHADIIWLNRLLWRWQEMSRDFGFETYDLVKWRETLLEELRANVEKAMKFEESDPFDERMAHLLRINALAAVFGQRVSAWIPTFSHNMTRLLSHRLERGGDFGEDERAIIDDLVATARAEVGKSRYWKSNELMDLIELSERARPVG